MLESTQSRIQTYLLILWFTLKPIFHYNAKPFALGTSASPNANDTKLLVSFALGNANFSRHPTQNPNASQWNIGCVGYQMQISCVGNVHLMFFCVDFICVWYPTQTQFPVEYGL